MIVGPDDNVQCFQCGGGFRNWKQDDDPWVEHQRWFPRCPFVAATRSRAFDNGICMNIYMYVILANSCLIVS